MANSALFNSQYGGFSLSAAASERLGDDTDGVMRARHDPAMLAVVDELGLEASSGNYCTLEKMELEGEWYTFTEYDGAETMRDDICMSVHSTSDPDQCARHVLRVSLQKLYELGFIKERAVRGPPKSVAE